MLVVSAISMFDSLSIINQILLIHCSRASICALTFGVFSNRCCFIFGGSFGINRRSWRVLRLQVRQHASHVLKCRLKRPRVSKKWNCSESQPLLAKSSKIKRNPLHVDNLSQNQKYMMAIQHVERELEFDPTRKWIRPSLAPQIANWVFLIISEASTFKSSMLWPRLRASGHSKQVEDISWMAL